MLVKYLSSVVKVHMRERGNTFESFHPVHPADKQTRSGSRSHYGYPLHFPIKTVHTGTLREPFIRSGVKLIYPNLLGQQPVLLSQITMGTGCQALLSTNFNVLDILPIPVSTLGPTVVAAGEMFLY